MRLVFLGISALVVVAGCDSDSDGHPAPGASDAADESSSDASNDATLEAGANACDGGGLSQEGCACWMEGAYQCVTGGGIECIGGHWRVFFDGPCSPPWRDASACEDRVLGCKCSLFEQEICENGEGLVCNPLFRRWLSRPSACGDASRPDGGDGDATDVTGNGDATDVTVDGDATVRSDADDADANNCGAPGPGRPGCPCATEGSYFCSAGDGVVCKNGVWQAFSDGPCWPSPDGGFCTDVAPGCRCPILNQHVCAAGQTLVCFEFDGRWHEDATMVCDGGVRPIVQLSTGDGRRACR